MPFLEKDGTFSKTHISYQLWPASCPDTTLGKHKAFSVNQTEVIGQGGRAHPWTHHAGDRWSPVTPTGTASYRSQFQDVTSSKKFQHFSSYVKNGGGEISGRWWTLHGAGAGAGQDGAAAGVGGSWLSGNFWTQDIFNYFLFWVNPNSSALNPAINSNLHQSVSSVFSRFPFHSRQRISLFLLSQNLFWAFALLSTFSWDFLGDL